METNDLQVGNISSARDKTEKHLVYLKEFAENSSGDNKEVLQRKEYWKEIIREIFKRVKEGLITEEEGIEAIALSKAISESQAKIDTLTGLDNLNGFKEKMDEILASAKRQNFPISLVFIDVNNLKPLNDTKGHEVANQFLKDLAQTFKINLRGGDVIGRFGGDEFIIALPFTKKAGGLALLLRIEERVNQIIHSLELSNLTKPLGLSFGIVEWDGQESLDNLQNRADQEMYKDKRKKKAND